MSETSKDVEKPAVTSPGGPPQPIGLPQESEGDE